MTNELRTNIKALHLQNAMEVEDYINYPEESVIYGSLTDQEIVDLTKPTETDEPDDSIEIRKFTHKEVLDALDMVSHYLMQQDNDMTKYICIISKIIKEVRNLRVESLQQTNLESFFGW